MRTQEKELFEQLRTYAQKKRLSAKEIARRMNVAEITVTAWLTGKHRYCNKTKLIRDFLDGKKIPLPPPVLFETPPDPITKVFLKVWKTLSPLDRARVYCKAVELKDGTCAVPR